MLANESTPSARCFGLLRPGAVGVPPEQFSLDPRAVDDHEFGHARNGGVGPDVGAGIRLVAGRQDFDQQDGAPRPSAHATAWRRSPLRPGRDSSCWRGPWERCPVRRSLDRDSAARSGDYEADRSVRPGLLHGSRFPAPLPRARRRSIATSDLTGHRDPMTGTQPTSCVRARDYGEQPCEEASTSGWRCPIRRSRFCTAQPDGRNQKRAPPSYTSPTKWEKSARSAG